MGAYLARAVAAAQSTAARLQQGGSWLSALPMLSAQLPNLVHGGRADGCDKKAGSGRQEAGSLRPRGNNRGRKTPGFWLRSSAVLLASQTVFLDQLQLPLPPLPSLGRADGPWCSGLGHCCCCALCLNAYTVSDPLYAELKSRPAARVLPTTARPPPARRVPAIRCPPPPPPPALQRAPRLSTPADQGAHVSQLPTSFFCCHALLQAFPPGTASSKARAPIITSLPPHVRTEHECGGGAATRGSRAACSSAVRQA